MQDKIEKILNEDLTYNDGMVGDSSWQQKAMPISVSILDILKLDRNDWEKAKAVLPYQATPIIGKIVSAIESSQDLKSDFSRIVSHPIIRKDEQKKQVIKNAQAKLNGIIKAYAEIVKELEKLRLD